MLRFVLTDPSENVFFRDTGSSYGPYTICLAQVGWQPYVVFLQKYLYIKSLGSQRKKKYLYIKSLGSQRKKF